MVCPAIVPLCINNVAGEELRGSDANGQSRDSVISGFVSWEDVVGTYGRTIRRLQVGMHLLVPAVAERVSVVPLSASYAALASRMVRDAC